MAEDPVQDRRERLAATLRENLRRRKAQARAVVASRPDNPAADPPASTDR